MTKILAGLFTLFLFAPVAFASTALAQGTTAQPQAGQEISDEYTQKIQPIFNNKCLSCHSCFNAPCQMNLQNYEGFARGANKLNVYDGLRMHSVQPSRLWIDAQTPAEWRKKEFFAVNTSKDPENNLFFQMIAMKNPKLAPPNKQVAESQICAANATEQKAYAKNFPEAGMPYGFPALTNEESATLQAWIKRGAPGPSQKAQEKLDSISPATEKQIRQWEQFLNASDNRQKLVSRYLYEHLFLAHLYFKSSISPDHADFFRLVRSKTSCEKEIEEIATRRPNDDPKTKEFFYCIKKFPASIVAKTHIPYEFSEAKLKRLREIFFDEKLSGPWTVAKLPGYDSSVAENPFVAFQDIPVKARYDFLLEDAHYEINTFIKGSVCNGSNAVNSIQEQFFVFFLDPAADRSVTSREYADKAKDLLMLPGMWGSDIPPTESLLLLKKITEHREGYRQLRSAEMKNSHPQGYQLHDIWDGNGTNPNAVLTVFRHFDNAVILKGAVGDLSKTMFVLDYPLFERLVYNLVVNFDVFGNVGHQSLTRIYMDMIRMEAEELFLNFLPPDQRSLLRKQWYQGFFTDLKMKFIFRQLDLDFPAGIRFKHPEQAKLEFIQKILFERMNQQVRGPIDDFNWKVLQAPPKLKSKLDPAIEPLSKITSIKAGKKTPFAQFLPDIANITLEQKNHTQKIFTLIHNREHENISWILAENLRMAPQEDSLTLTPGFAGSYPNMFFLVAEADVKEFANDIRKLNSADDYQKLVSHFGVQRTQERFWEAYERLNTAYRKQDPINFGYLDLTRYALENK